MLTDRLVIRTLVRSDAPAVMATIDQVVEDTNGWLPQTKHDLVGAIEAGWAHGHRAICIRSSGEVIGVVQVYSLAQIQAYRLAQMAVDQCQIGFWIGAPHRQQGYATEAVAAFVDHLHGLGMRSVHASTATTNEPVRLLLARVGFEPAPPRQHTLPNGEVLDALDFRHVAIEG